MSRRPLPAPASIQNTACAYPWARQRGCPVSGAVIGPVAEVLLLVPCANMHRALEVVHFLGGLWQRHEQNKLRFDTWLRFGY